MAERNPRASLTRQSILVASACLVIDVLAFVVEVHAHAGEARWFVVLVAVALADVALATPTRWSGAVAVAGTAVQVAGTFTLGRHMDSAGLLIAAYRAGAWLSGIEAVGALAVMVAGGLVCQRYGPHYVGFQLPIDALKNALLPWMVGRYTTARRAYLDELKQRSDLAERDAREAVERALAEDRSAIARDLHDVIAHHVSAINVHAGAARLGLAGGSADGSAEGSLQAVETASRAAMADLRHLLDVLHGEHPDGVRQPGLDNLEELFDGVRAAGIPATLHTRGTPRPVPDSLSVALYRIAQEMLTNALRHGDGAGVEMSLDYGDHGLELSTVNGVGHGTGLVIDDSVPHRGLAGIRNRARLFAGSTSTGPEPGGRRWRTAVTFDQAAGA